LQRSIVDYEKGWFNHPFSFVNLYWVVLSTDIYKLNKF
jgi:hypothetical protein